MMLNTSGITIVAWWGAILSTVVFSWDIYKWLKAGPKLRVSVSTGMQSINIPDYDGKTLILVNVSNYGDRATTITTLGLRYFPSRFARLRNKATKVFVLANPSPSQPPPFELKPGGVWCGVGVQSPDVVKLATSGHLLIELYHSHREKPEKRRVLVRIKP